MLSAANSAENGVKSVRKTSKRESGDPLSRGFMTGEADLLAGAGAGGLQAMQRRRGPASVTRGFVHFERIVPASPLFGRVSVLPIP